MRFVFVEILKNPIILVFIMNKISFYTCNDIEIVTGTGMHEFPYHSHNSYMAGAVLDGCGEFCIDKHFSILNKNDVYVVPSNTAMSMKPMHDFSYITICFKNDLANMLNKCEAKKYYYRNLGYILLNMSDNFQAKLIDENTFTNTLIKLLNLKVSNTPLQPKNSMITKAMQYINDNCAEKFDLERLAEEVFLSKYYLVRLFRREMGITPHQYYQQCKVRELRKMAPCFSQKNIAYELNFSTQSHMDSVFKKYMGITMKNYISSIEHK